MQSVDNIPNPISDNTQVNIHSSLSELSQSNQDVGPNQSNSHESDKNISDYNEQVNLSLDLPTNPKFIGLVEDNCSISSDFSD